MQVLNRVELSRSKEAEQGRKGNRVPGKLRQIGSTSRYRQFDWVSTIDPTRSSD